MRKQAWELLLGLSLAASDQACAPRTLPDVSGSTNPPADAWSTRPIAILTVLDPWASPQGPRLVIYHDGTVIRGEITRTGGVFTTGHLLPNELIMVRRCFRPTSQFLALRDHYDLQPNVSDLRETEIALDNGGTLERVTVRGLYPDGQGPAASFTSSAKTKADELPKEFQRLLDLFESIHLKHEVPWSPRFIEVLVWPYDHSPDVPENWPADFPSLTSDRAFRFRDSYSLVMNGDQLPKVLQLIEQRGEKQAVLIEGREWSIWWQPIIPGSTFNRQLFEVWQPPAS